MTETGHENDTKSEPGVSDKAVDLENQIAAIGADLQALTARVDNSLADISALLADAGLSGLAAKVAAIGKWIESTAGETII